MRLTVLIASLWLTGCFYIDPINQRPSLDIRQDSVGPIFRGEEVSFTAVVVDPDDHGVDVTWRVYMCTDATTAQDCDPDPLFTDVTPTFGFMVPMTRADMVTPVAGFRLVLDGRDDHGATAKPTDILQLPVLDRNPDLDLQGRSVYEQPSSEFVVGMPIDLFATYGDGDDALDSLTVDWKVFSPMQVPIDLTDRTIEQTVPMKRSVYKVLVPQIKGPWTVEVTVTDPGGNNVKKPQTFTVVDDRPPCISIVAPIVPPGGVALPVMEPTLFQVPIVSDDLDSYPKTSGGAEFGESTFQWSILSGGNPRLPISGATGSGTVFDPSTFTPGTIVELRVEIKDRKLTPSPCADGIATCSIGANGCIQRQTWRVEAR